MATDSVSPYYSPMLDRTATVGTPASTPYARYTSGLNMIPNNVGLPAPSAATSASIVGTTGPPIGVFGYSGGTLYAPTVGGGTAPVTVSGVSQTDTGVTASPVSTTALMVGGGLLLLLVLL